MSGTPTTISRIEAWNDMHSGGWLVAVVQGDERHVFTLDEIEAAAEVISPTALDPLHPANAQVMMKALLRLAEERMK